MRVTLVAAVLKLAMAAYPPAPQPSAAYPPAPQPGGPASRVELRISCKNLLRSDILSKSDPLVAVYTLDQRGAYTEYARTEQIKNNENPQFIKCVEITYQFEVIQKLKFVVYDIDNETATLGDDECLGSMECTLGEIVSAQSFTKPLQILILGQLEQKGTITITAEEVASEKNLLELQFSAQGLDKKDFLGKSDPYLEFARINPNGSYTSVHKIPHVLNTLNPHWPPFKVESSQLCGNDTSRSIRVQCFDWDEMSAPDLIGEFYTSLAEISKVAEGKKLEWEAINPEKKRKKKSYKNSGTITLNAFKSTRMYSFLDYVMGGCQINFTVGVDFTASNGDPSHPQSLHFIDPVRPNEYTHALWAVGGVCQDYDTDKLFPAFGFGAKLEGKVSHEFPLNGNWENPYCAGIQGVVQAYHQSLQRAQLYGPTNVAPIINHVACFAQQAASTEQGASTTQNYFVLLLLTDGVLSDMTETKKALIKASRYPMSVIIVGVGGADFSAMDELDSDDRLLRVGSDVAARDICQFVPFRKYAAQGSPAAMASAVLAEVPTQVTQYFNNKGIPPPRLPQK